jgi:protocatechuate 3,4-dioxygenase beta subunit
LSYSIEDKSVVISKKNNSVQQVTAQPGALVHGYIYDEKNRPLPGASVRIVGFRQSASTDEKGMYVVNDVPPGGVNGSKLQCKFSRQAKF